nr:uncharacterized protein LOC111422633 isoform X1 [Onthophagus taurus]XP_022911617.1 uncharacterized protein LOC111422633 isoform X1 [Onthophagus taurus]
MQISFREYNPRERSYYFKWMAEKCTYVDKTSQKEKQVRKTSKKKVECQVSDIIADFKQSIIPFLKHKGRSLHQYKQLKELKENLRITEAVIHMDFSENYNMKYAEEIQAFHFGGSRKQISLHTVVVYTKQDEVQQQCFCTLSESLLHNVPAIWAHLDPIIKCITNSYPTVDTLHFISDSPSTQYRNKTMFYFLAIELPKLHPKVKNFTWNYLEAGHGKGAPDGIGGVTKRTLDRLVGQGADMVEIKAMLNNLCQNIQNITYYQIDADKINEMSQKLKNVLLQTFRGTMKVHQIKKEDYESSIRLNFYELSTFINGNKKYFIGSLKFNKIGLNDELSLVTRLVMMRTLL